MKIKLLIIFCLQLLFGCDQIKFLEPLIKNSNPELTIELDGIWVEKDEKIENSHLYSFYKDKCIVFENKKNELKSSELSYYLCKYGNTKYIQFHKAETEKDFAIPSYQLFKYEIDSNGLTLFYTLNASKFLEIVNQKVALKDESESKKTDEPIHIYFEKKEYSDVGGKINIKTIEKKIYSYQVSDIIELLKGKNETEKLWDLCISLKKIK